MKVKDLIDGVSENYIDKISELTGLDKDTILNVQIKTKNTIVSKFLKPFISIVDGEGVTISKNTIVFVKEFKLNSSFLSLLCHELTHIAQMRRIGTIKFPFKYMKEYLENTKHYPTIEDAYRNISYEKKAYANQKAFVEYCYRGL